MGTLTEVGKATTCSNYVDGKWVDSHSGKAVERRNPARHDDLIGHTPLSSREELRTLAFVLETGN